MAKHRETALVSEKGNVQTLVNSVGELIENDKLRLEIAKNGYEFIQQFTWDIAYGKFTKFLIENKN